MIDFDLIKRAFIHAEIGLSKTPNIDANLSGATCVMVIQIGEKILCANVGNSRAILVKEYYEVNKIILLSREQKPDDPGESERIIEFGGKISQFVEDGKNFGPYRVWKKGVPYPGIAIFRTIGDIIATTLGVISESKIIEEIIDKFTKFIVIATDGLSEYLKNR
jgi:serine/threonine protein phosphatase PrpC